MNSSDIYIEKIGLVHLAKTIEQLPESYHYCADYDGYRLFHTATGIYAIKDKKATAKRTNDTILYLGDCE